MICLLHTPVGYASATIRQCDNTPVRKDRLTGQSDKKGESDKTGESDKKGQSDTKGDTKTGDTKTGDS